MTIGSEDSGSVKIIRSLTFNKNAAGSFDDGKLTINVSSNYSVGMYVKPIGSTSYGYATLVSRYNNSSTSSSGSNGYEYEATIPASILNKGGGSSESFCQNSYSSTSSLFGLYGSSDGVIYVHSATLTLSTGEVYRATIS